MLSVLMVGVTRIVLQKPQGNAFLLLIAEFSEGLLRAGVGGGIETQGNGLISDRRWVREAVWSSLVALMRLARVKMTRMRMDYILEEVDGSLVFNVFNKSPIKIKCRGE